ncbi:MAG: fused ferrous iron transport protein A/B [Elusimicrobiales bacterium]|nr:fused ferrous iron transport protein A/B [Elusimicrobiales bacterium]
MKPSPPLTLVAMREDEAGYIVEVDGGADFQAKLRAMGLYAGRHITKRSRERSGGPVVVEVMGTRVALGRGMAAKVSVKVKSRRILLAGNPNVGKSVVFSRLTGLEVISSNYPGTTVEYTAGHTVLAGERFSVVDVPGAYSHAATNKAEEVARDILAEEDKALILNVVDATNLERNLFYTLELASLCSPLVILLNKWDIARRKGVEIDPASLGRHLGVRVIPFVATTGEGLSGLKTAVEDFNAGRLPAPACLPSDPDEKWKLIGRISAECQKIVHKHATFLEKLEDITSRPSTGLPFAAGVLLGVFLAIRFVGENLISRVLDPLFQAAWLPLVTKALAGLQDGSALKLLLLGSSPVPMESFGLLTTGLYIPFVTVLPYIVSFYAALGVLEDIGYLPRLAVMLDSSMHRVGLHGYGTIPLMLGLGCKVPAILAARVLETPRERVIATALTLALAPCMPQTAMIFSLLSPYPLKYTLAVFAAIAAAGIAASLLLSRLLKGETPELFLEIPPYQAPCCRVMGKKLYFRVKDFLLEAVPMIVAGVGVIALLDLSGVLAGVAAFFKPAVTGLLGLPGETVSVMVLGFLRKDVSIAMLTPFALSPGSIVVASVFLSLYLPCLGSFLVTVRELGPRDAARVFAVNFLAALLFASALNVLVRIL